MASKPTPTTPSDIKERLKASYDSIASTYNEWTLPHSKLRISYLGNALDRLNLPSETTPQSSTSTSTSTPTFLELGCGHGLPVTLHLLTHASSARVIANDLSSTQIALARRNLLTPSPSSSSSSTFESRLTLLQKDMTTLTFPPSSISLAVAFYSIIHLPRAEQSFLLSQIADWLEPGGLFVGNFAVEASEAIVAEKWLGEEKGWMYWSAWGKEKTLDEMRKVGLEIVVADVVEDEVDSTVFVWVIAAKR